MFDFAYPYLLNLLWLIPILFGVFWWSQMRRRKRLARFGNADVIAHLMPDVSPYKPAVKMTLRLIALAAIIIVLARPRAGERQQDETVAGIEVMIAFDVSNSMLASSTDDPDGTPRLDRARLLLDKLVDRLHNDKVGLVIFAGTAKTQMPMTTDIGAAKMYLNDLHPSLMTYQGTSIAEAISMASQGFGQAEDVHKAIILITDSEDHEGEAIEAAKEAAKKGIQIDVMGLGSAKGAPVPDYTKPGQYITDSETGQIAITTLNEHLAEEIANAGGGIFVNGASSDALSVLVDKLETLQKSEFKHVKYTAGAEQFPIFAWLAFLFLLIDQFVLDRKNTMLSKINFFTKNNKS